ncbi:hypothetical protein FISHEDRAFT_52784 [Fistulina hepatica ATCC 64428]|nr:hypothetical protein FISHEDRAFT_52784 [Fistulina hepatica ATCC 64428]
MTTLRVARRCTHLTPLSRGLATEAAIDHDALCPVVPRSKRPEIATGIILNRSPILTRTPSAFETAYYSYQARIRRALHNPFPSSFYFKQGSLLRARFEAEELKRERDAFGSAFGKRKVKVSREVEMANNAAIEQLMNQEGEGERLSPRRSPADFEKDYKSLDRLGPRNLYLLLQTNKNDPRSWRFPQGGLEKGELLHQAAQRDLFRECGNKMDTWIVGRNPIGMYKPAAASVPNVPLQELSLRQKIVFFFKVHIMAGQCHLNPELNLADFAWLTKQEIQNRMSPDYWDGVKDMLSDF